ncbi:adenosine receptor A2b-like [Rhopilema esculentum]|uniref:adenosine receptor A2b-like n=1 Tax=Rhopilema esculentum TaxID=499914 RepID=UPI0031DEA0D6|eukprot:gene14115-5108_t
MQRGLNNTTTPMMPSILPYQPAFHTSLIILSVLTTAHNLLVLVVYKKNRSLHTPTNFILSNLACCDLMTGCIFLPLMISTSMVVNRSLQFATNVFADLTVIGIVLCLTSVTYERYLNLCHPYQYPIIVNKCRVRILVGVIWTIAALMSLVPIVWSHNTLNKAPGKEAKSFKQAYQAHSLVVLVIFFVIPTTVSLYALIAMFCVVRRLTKNDPMVNAKLRRKRERRVVLVFLAMYACLIICWTPMILVRISLDFHLNLFVWQRWHLELFLCLRGLPSFTNPLIYVWCKQDFRQSVFKIKAIQKVTTMRTKLDISERILMVTKNAD